MSIDPCTYLDDKPTEDQRAKRRRLTLCVILSGTLAVTIGVIVDARAEVAGLFFFYLVGLVLAGISYACSNLVTDRLGPENPARSTAYNLLRWIGVALELLVWAGGLVVTALFIYALLTIPA